MSSTYGHSLRLSIFGQSHASAIGMTLDGLPAGLAVDEAELSRFLARRAPGRNEFSTARKEPDAPEFLCGLVNGRTCGAPLTAVIRNTNTRPGDYAALRALPRPGHADYTAECKYHGFQDPTGGGHFSGRLTAPLCIAGGVCLQILERMGVRVFARITSIADITDDAPFTAPVSEKPFPVVDDTAGQRMRTAAGIAAYKKEHHLPVLDPLREREKLDALSQLAPEEFSDYTRRLYIQIFELSRSYQDRLLGTASPLPQRIEQALESTPALFPEKAMVACQGVAGAYAQIACDKLFRQPSVFYVSSFDAVFSAIEQGLCQYGVIPLENSTAGSVNRVYDLMMRHKFSIVRSCRLKIDHQLAALPGAELGGIREIYSHQQAIDQCSDFLQSLKNVTIHRCENTAVAAKLVAESGRKDAAALCSRDCMALYSLVSLKGGVQNQQNNYTRFICISRKLEIFPGADRTSLMAVLAHRPGSLYQVLARLNALGINLNKLESRPIPDRDFEFMFYFDLNVSVYSPQLLQLLGELDDACEQFHYLGSYSEVI